MVTSGIKYLLNPMREYHDKTRRIDHVFRKMRIITEQNYHRLLTRDSFTHIVFVLAPIVLARLQ